LDAEHVQHRVLLYGGADAFVDAVAPFVRDGLEAGDTVLVAVTAEKVQWLREHLGDAADRVELVDAAEMYARNGPMLNTLLQRFVARGETQAQRTRVVAEQALAARSPAEARAYLRYEAAANIAYHALEASVLCPYDTVRLPDSVLEQALEVHPRVLDGHHERANAAFADPREFIRRHSVVKPPPPDATEIALESLQDLPRVRHRISERAEAAGLTRARLDELTVAATELATNALRHGAEPRRIWTYVQEGEFICQVDDGGRGLADPLAGYLVPDLAGSGGRGLWLAHQLCDIVEAATDAAGTHVCVRMAL
jgi:anti-sigma regulatory factor (Ser/Thr protein kinase)